MMPEDESMKDMDELRVFMNRIARRPPTDIEFLLCRCPNGERCILHPEYRMLAAIGTELADHRRGLQMSQRSAADVTGMAQSQIAYVEHGSFSKGLRRIALYAGKFLHMDVKLSLENRPETE